MKLMIQAGFTFALHEAVRKISAPQRSGQFLHINKSVESTFPEEITQTTSVTFNHHHLLFISLWLQWSHWRGSSCADRIMFQLQTITTPSMDGMSGEMGCQ